MKWGITDNGEKKTIVAIRMKAASMGIGLPKKLIKKYTHE